MIDDDFYAKLEENQKLLYSKMTVMQQEICLNVLCTPGMTWVEAYKESPFPTSTNYRSIAMQASHVQRNKKVQAFLKSVREAEFDERILKRDEALRILTRQARGTLEDVVEFKSHFLGMCPDGGGPMWQTKWGLRFAEDLDPELMENIVEISDTKDGVKIKNYSKRDAVRDLSRMQGWDSATRHIVATEPGKPAEIKIVDPSGYQQARKKMMDDDDC